MKTRARNAPLDEDGLRRFALAYVGRYATTRARLADYLRRKVAMRGWAGEEAPAIEALVDYCAEAGFVDDEAFARMRSDALTRRGYGNRRIGAALAASGIAQALALSVAQDEDEARNAAEAFAQRKRFGRFAHAPMDEPARRRAIAAMVRAGHSFALAREFSSGSPPFGPEQGQ